MDNQYQQSLVALMPHSRDLPTRSIMKHLSCILLLAFGALAAMGMIPAHAESGPFRLLIPYAAGGAPDIIARLITPQLAQSFGQSFIVENKVGGSGIPAVQELLHSPADGHTVLMTDTQTVCINPFLHTNLPYDPARDFAPVTYAASLPLYLAVQSSLGVNTLAELIKLAKSKPGELTYGSSGVGSIHHIAMESFNALSGVNIRHIPYRGAAQSVPAFFRGDTSMVMAGYSAFQGFLVTGKIKLLAVTSLTRSPEAPDVPPIAELLNADYDFNSEMGFAVRIGTPPDIVEKLSREMVAALQNPQHAKILRAAGIVVQGTSAAEYRDKIVRDLVKFEKAVAISGAKPQ